MIDPSAVIDLESLVRKHAVSAPQQAQPHQDAAIAGEEPRIAPSGPYDDGPGKPPITPSRLAPANTDAPLNVATVQSTPRPSRVQELLDRESGHGTAMRNRLTREGER